MIQYLVGTPYLFDVEKELPEEGYNVIVYGEYDLNGTEKYDKLSEEQRSGILYDIGMRVKDGWELVYLDRKVPDDFPLVKIKYWWPFPETPDMEESK